MAAPFLICDPARLRMTSAYQVRFIGRRPAMRGGWIFAKTADGDATL
jgi:hypothetical protein